MSTFIRTRLLRFASLTFTWPAHFFEQPENVPTLLPATTHHHHHPHTTIPDGRPNDTPARFSHSLYHCERQQSLRECVAAASWWLVAAGGFVVVWLFGCRGLFLAVWASVWGDVWLAGLCSLVRIQAPYEARGFWCIAAPPLPSWSQVKADNPTTTNFLQYVLLMFFQTKPTPTTVCNHRSPVGQGPCPPRLTRALVVWYWRALSTGTALGCV